MLARVMKFKRAIIIAYIRYLPLLDLFLKISHYFEFQSFGIKILQHLSAPPVELSRTRSDGHPTDTDISGFFSFSVSPFPEQSAESCRFCICPALRVGQDMAESFLALISTSAVAITCKIIPYAVS